MTASPRFAVLVVTYDRNEELDDALEGIMRQTVGRQAMEICVVHNGGSTEARARWKDRVDVWADAETNLGCAGGRNRGSELTSAPILVFVDDDGIPEADFVERLAEVLDRYPEAVAVRGRARYLRHPILTTMAAHYHRGPEICEAILNLEGASAIRREAFERVGGYDTSRAYHEGLELSARLLEVSDDATILYTPHAVLRHDYAKGVRHLNAKARAMAAADDKLAADVEPRVAALMKRFSKTKDGRQPWERFMGDRLQRFFRRLIKVHRYRRRLLGQLGV